MYVRAMMAGRCAKVFYGISLVLFYLLLGLHARGAQAH